MTQAIHTFSILGEDECVADWLPVPGKSLAVEVLRHADWVNIPGRQIVVDIECEVFEACINDWFPQPGDRLELEFKCCALECNNNWEYVRGDSVYLDATEDLLCDRSWFETAGNELDFDFSCCDGSWREESGNALEFDFNCPGDSVIMDVPACDTTCLGTWVPQPGDQLEIEYLCCGTSSGGQEIILTDVFAHEGATLTFDYTSDKQFVPLVTEGQTLAANLTAPQNIVFNAGFDTGETVNVELRTSSSIPVDFFAGEEARPVLLNVYPTIPLVAYGYEGQTLATALYTTSYLGVSYQTGETVGASLDTRQAQDLRVTFQTGENSTADIVTHRLFPITIEIGEQITAELTALPYEGIQVEFAVGETLTTSIDATPGFIVRVYAGETLETSVSASPNFPVALSAGETLSVTLYQAQYWNPEPTATTGETMYAGFSVGTFSFGRAMGESGEEVTAILTTREKIPLVANGQHGETATVAVSWAAGLAPANFYHGTTAVVDTIEFDSLYLGHDGAMMAASFSTQTTLPGAAFEGSRFNIDLTTGPAQTLGRITAMHGEGMFAEIGLLKAVSLGVTFYNSYTFNVGAPYIGTFMDLDTGCCSNHYPGQQDYHRIEMNDAEFGDQKFDGDRIRATVDFQTQPRFRFNFTTGETARTVEQDLLLTAPRVFAGETLSVTLESRHINFPLCPVNFIPDGDNVYVELDYVDGTSCYSDYFHAGEVAVVGTLQANQNFQSRMFEGQVMTTSLTTDDERLRFNFYNGNGFTMASNVEFQMRAFTGESGRAGFYVEPIIGATGETMYAGLTTLYEVLFLEDGCLDNEYIWQDENGDPIPEKFNTVPVELDPYQHDLKAKCQ